MGWEERDWARRSDGKRRPWLRLALVAAAVVLVAAALGLLARGSSSEPQATGGPWPAGQIRYFNAAPEHAWAVRRAVAAWNESGVQIRFVASSADRAQLTISAEDTEGCGHGHGTLGYTPDAKAAIFRLGDAAGCDRFSAARVLAHELGHVLGLDHDDRGCASMNTRVNRRGAALCRPAAPWEWRCRLLEEADVLAAVRLYGGEPASVRGSGNCSLYEPLQPPLAVRPLSERSTADHVAFSFVRPADPVAPPFLRAFVHPAYTFSFVRGACRARPESPRYRWSVAAGQEQVGLFPILGKGVHCLRVWAADSFGRLSETPSTAQVNVS